jgi:hypothetical protein
MAAARADKPSGAEGTDPPPAAPEEPLPEAALLETPVLTSSPLHKIRLDHRGVGCLFM